MSFVLIATHRLKPGAMAAERARIPELVEFLETHEPRLIAFNEYADEEAEEVTVVQIHPDAESLRFHTEVVGERAARAYAETLDATLSIELYGDPGDELRATLRRQAGDRFRLTVKPHLLGGFTRTR
jgi:hypothetical protein